MTLTHRGGTLALVVNAKALKKGRCKGNDTQGKVGNPQADCTGERPQAEGMEERGQGGMISKETLEAWKDQPILHDEDEWNGAYATYGEMWAGEGYTIADN